MNTFELNAHLQSVAKKALDKGVKEIFSKFQSNDYLKNPLTELQRLTRMLDIAKTAHAVNKTQALEVYATPNSAKVLARWKLLLMHQRAQSLKSGREFPCEGVVDEYQNMLKLGHTEALNPNGIQDQHEVKTQPSTNTNSVALSVKPPTELTAMANAFRALGVIKK